MQPGDPSDRPIRAKPPQLCIQGSTVLSAQCGQRFIGNAHAYSQSRRHTVCVLPHFIVLGSSLFKHDHYEERLFKWCWRWLSPRESAYVTIARWLVHHVETQMKR